MMFIKITFDAFFTRKKISLIKKPNDTYKKKKKDILDLNVIRKQMHSIF